MAVKRRYVSPADWCAKARQARRPLIVSVEEIGGKGEIAAFSCAICFSVLIRVRPRRPRDNVGKYP
jgi:hypothetical protein